MALVKDSARITRSGRPLPDVTKNELPVSAWLVWETVKNEVLKEKDPERRSHEGVDGWIWRGVVNVIFRELWSGMLDSYTGNKEEVITAKREISLYLRDTRNLVCLDRGVNVGPQTRLPTWWVRAEWNDAPPPPRGGSLVPTYAERRLTPAEAGEDRPHAPVETRIAPRPSDVKVSQRVKCPDCTPERTFADERYLTQHREAVHPAVEEPAGAFPCRAGDCDRVFTNPQGRGNHENAHQTKDVLVGEAVNWLRRFDGDATQFTVAQVARAAGHHPTSIYSFFGSTEELIEAARKVIAAEGSGGETTATPVEKPSTSAPLDTKLDVLTVRRKLLELLAFADLQGSPVTITIMRLSVTGVPTELRNQAIDELIADGQIRAERRADHRGRTYEVWLPTVDVDLSWVAGTSAATPAEPVSTTVVDPAEYFAALLAEHEKLRADAAAATDLARVAGEAEARARAAEEKLGKVTSLLTGN